MLMPQHLFFLRLVMRLYIIERDLRRFVSTLSLNGKVEQNVFSFSCCKPFHIYSWIYANLPALLLLYLISWLEAAIVKNEFVIRSEEI